MPLIIRKVLPTIIREGNTVIEGGGGQISFDEVLFTYVRPTDEPEIDVAQSFDQITTTTPAP